MSLERGPLERRPQPPLSNPTVSMEGVLFEETFKKDTLQKLQFVRWQLQREISIANGTVLLPEPQKEGPNIQ